MANSYQETNTLIEVRDVALNLGGQQILDGVDLAIKDLKEPGKVRGQVRCILGPSGIGKTQLLRIITGLNRPDRGTVRVSRDGVNLVPVQAGMIGVVGQTYPLFDHLTVMGNLVLSGTASGLERSAARERALKLLERFGLLDRADFWPSQLSGGQKQRIAILQQIMGDRIFLIMDEPFSGLDPKALHSIINVVTDIASSDELNTMMIITHDIRAAVIVADSIHILGREYDRSGAMVRSAHVVAEINLVERGLAWRPDIRKLPQFNETINEIEDIFEKI